MNSKFNRAEVKSSSTIVEKWGSSGILSEGYIPLPKKLVRALGQIFNGDENMRMLAALLAIVDFNRANLVRNPTNDYLAFMAGLPDDVFLKAIHDLMQNGFLAEGQIGDPGSPAHYNFSPFVDKICELTPPET